jgi:hypothetical protein
MPDAPGLRDDAVALRLENLEALTDTTLTRLDVDDLLVELLDRVREILDVDTAAVLMLTSTRRQSRIRSCGKSGIKVMLGVPLMSGDDVDADSEVLVARAACGIDPTAPVASWRRYVRRNRLHTVTSHVADDDPQHCPGGAMNRSYQSPPTGQRGSVAGNRLRSSSRS